MPVVALPSPPAPLALHEMLMQSASQALQKRSAASVFRVLREWMPSAPAAAASLPLHPSDILSMEPDATGKDVVLATKLPYGHQGQVPGPTSATATQPTMILPGHDGSNYNVPPVSPGQAPVLRRSTLAELSTSLAGMKQRNEQVSSMAHTTPLYLPVRAESASAGTVRPVIVIGAAKDAVLDALLQNQSHSYATAATHTTGYARGWLAVRVAQKEGASTLMPTRLW
jgi:hypothetical protein